LGGTRVGRADGTNLDVGIGDGDATAVSLNLGWHTGGGWARATSDTRSRWVSVGGVVGVEPEHVDRIVVPDGENESHTAGEGLVHWAHTTLAEPVVVVALGGLDICAVVGLDGIVSRGDTWDVDVGVGDDDTVLDIETADFRESTAGGSSGGQELGDNGEWLGGIDTGESWAVEVLDTIAVRVEVASALVANTSRAVSITAVVAASTAAVRTIDCARMGGIGGRDGVGLPEIHFIAACAVFALSAVGAVGIWVPADVVGLTADELDVVGALRVAVTSSVLGTSLVVGELGHASVSVHLGEVDGTVETARKLGDINVEGELLSLHLELLVHGGAAWCHEVDTRTDVAASLELEGKSGSRSGDTVCTAIVGTFESAVLSASSAVGVGAVGSVPSVAIVAVGGTTDIVDPTPISIEDNAGALGGA
jgi:hypothetical protein